MREASTGSTTSDSGSFAELTTADLFRTLLREHSTGALKVRSGAQRRTVYLEFGTPVYAESSDPAETIGEVLRRAGRLTREQLRRALATAATASEVGAALVRSGMPPADLVWATRQLVREIVLGLFTLDEGEFVFHPGPLGDDILRLPVPPHELLREGVDRITDPRLLLRSLGSLDGQLEISTVAEPAVPLALSPTERTVVEALRSARMSVRDLCRQSSSPAIATCRAALTLVTAGTARRVRP